MQPGDQLSTSPLRPETDLPESHLVLRETAVLVATTDLPLSWKLLVTRVVDLHAEGGGDERLNAAAVYLFRAYEEATEEAKAKIKTLARAAPLQLQGPLKSLASKAAKLLKQEGVSSSPVSEIKTVLCFFQLSFCALPVTDSSTQPVFAIFETASVRIPHSCSPNCFILTRVLEDGAVLADLVTLKAIGAGELLTVSYLPFTMLRASRGHRQRMLLAVRGFACRSSCCVGGPDLRRRMPCAVCARDANCWASEESGGVWTSSQCGRTSSEAPVSEELETRILKKVNIVQNLETADFDKVMSVARPVIDEAMAVLGKKHFATQIALQLLLVAKAQQLTQETQEEVSDKLLLLRLTTLEEFNAVVEDLVAFGLETDLPFLGLDEVANILTAPAILEAAACLAGKFPRKSPSTAATEGDSVYSERALACMRKFESFFFLAVGTIQAFQNPDQIAVVNKLVHLWFTLSRSPQAKLVSPVSTAALTSPRHPGDTASVEDAASAGGSAWRTPNTWAVLLGLGVAAAAAALVVWQRSRRL